MKVTQKMLDDFRKVRLRYYNRIDLCDVLCDWVESIEDEYTKGYFDCMLFNGKYEETKFNVDEALSLLEYKLEYENGGQLS